MAQKVIDACRLYDDMSILLGVRNQIRDLWSLTSIASNGYISSLSTGDALLISLLNHQEINSGLVKSSFVSDDLKRVVAGRICDGAAGYVDISAVAEAVGLSENDVKDILNGIASGNITENSIKQGLERSKHTNRGMYLIAKAQKQEKVFNFLLDEAKRMSSNEESLYVLYDDLGEGYVKSMLSGEKLDQYKTQLYKEYLAKVLETEQPFTLYEYDVSNTGEYKTAKKVSSIISGIYEYEIDAAKAKISPEMQKFLEEHLKNGVLSDKEAREYLILSGEYEKGEHGIGEAAKTLISGYEQLQKFEEAMDYAGKVFDTVDKVKKVEEFLEYWFEDYAQQELVLSGLIDSLSKNGKNTELPVAAKDLEMEYTNKISGTLEEAYGEIIDKGIGSAKALFPPLKVTEACISLAGDLTGASDRVDAIETCIAMQSICISSVEAYENAVIAVNKGDESEEAVNRVLTSFGLAKQSLCEFYEAVSELSDSEEEKAAYEAELIRLQTMQVGRLNNTALRGGGGGGGR